MNWKYNHFLKQENLAVNIDNCCFCYGTIFENTTPDNFLQSLTFQQKIILWIRFLKDEFDYQEFEWLYQIIAQDIVMNRMEWELALHTAMQNIGYTIKVSPKDFELYDGQGRRRYFNYNSKSFAEKAFLKILFPLNL